MSETKQGPAKLGSMPNVYRLFKEQKGKIEAMLPKGANANRFMLGAADAVAKSKGGALLECTEASFMASIKQAAMLGLSIDGLTGESYLVPFKAQCSLLCGYKGYMKLVRQAPDVARVCANAVYEADEFDFELGGDAFLKHKPKAATAEDLDIAKLRWVYFLVTLRCGLHVPFVMPAAQVWSHRDKFAKEYKYQVSAGKSDSFWHKHPIPMAIKTVVRKACASGQLPLEADAARIAAFDEMIEREGDDSLGKTAVNSESANQAASELANRLESEQPKAQPQAGQQRPAPRQRPPAPAQRPQPQQKPEPAHVPAGDEDMPGFDEQSPDEAPW